jgi:hypothetical protein
MRALAAALNVGRFRAVVAVFFCPPFALIFAQRALWAAAMRALPAALIVGRFVVVLRVPPKLVPPRALIAASNLFNSPCNLLRSDFRVCNMFTLLFLRTLNCTNAKECNRESC